MNSGPAQPGGIVAAVNNAAAQAVQAVNSAASGAVEAAANVFQNVTTNVANAATNVVRNVPVLNSLIPIGNNGNGRMNNGAARANNGAGVAAGNNGRRNAGVAAGNGLWANLTTSPDQGANVGPAAAITNAVNSIANSAGNFSVVPANSGGDAWVGPLSIFAGCVVLFLIVFAVFNEQIKRGYEYFAQSVRKALGLSTATDVASQIVPADGSIRELTVPPEPPQAILPAQRDLQQQNIVEKILPSPGGNEVFNVAQNKFTYYDAEPLCKALGAELANYEQVKDAWGKGADWCNYGWVRGQMAVYPTQQNTYDKLQMGPADQRGVCGTTGLNGGYFDNPEMRFGVNCYGKKPSQSAHDEAELMDEGKIPRSPETLKVDQMVQEFKKEADSLFVKPFNNDKWGSA
jgi:hypothetical protein